MFFSQMLREIWKLLECDVTLWKGAGKSSWFKYTLEIKGAVHGGLEMSTSANSRGKGNFAGEALVGQGAEITKFLDTMLGSKVRE